MRVTDLGSRRVAVWGLGREGRAAIQFLRKHHPSLPLVLLDDSADARAPDNLGENTTCAFGTERIAAVLPEIEVIVKSPGVSLHRHEVRSARDSGAQITSLLNLWFSQQLGITTIGITGTKGKSTTASLIAHILGRLSRNVVLIGNIGVPVTDIDSATTDYAVVEISSYQAADFDGVCDVAALTSLFPEHIDWHLSVERYYRDKINLLNRSRCRIVACAAAEAVAAIIGATPPWHQIFNDENGIHSRGSEIYDGLQRIGSVRNAYLARAHNTSNLCAALAVLKTLGIAAKPALRATRDFQGLPHRQQELGEIGGVLFVDDSISTIPESTIAALAVYADRDVTVIVGGYDRGVDYSKLVEKFATGAAKAIICLGASGQRIHAQARAHNVDGALHEAESMEEAVSCATRITPPGGVVLLSPAAPSYGYYRDFIERGRDFAARVGLPAAEGPN